MLKCEQSCTESLALMCHRRRVEYRSHLSDHLASLIEGPIRKSGVSAMNPVVHRCLGRVHTVLAFITDSLRKFFGMRTRDFASQRIGPFCGLITSGRAKHVAWSAASCSKQLKSVSVGVDDRPCACRTDQMSHHSFGEDTNEKTVPSPLRIFV